MSGPSLHFKFAHPSLPFELKLLIGIITVLITTDTISAQQNVTLQNTNDQLVYLPRLCLDGEECDGGWRVVDLPGSSNGSVTSTNGPTSQTGDILPQVFLTFRGSALYIKTSAISNATANLTVSLLPSGILDSRVFSPSQSFWAFEGLDEAQLTTVAVTFRPQADSDSDTSENPTRLDIDFFKISVSNASETTSFLPSQTIPTSAFTPSFAPATTVFSPTVIPSSSPLPVRAIVGGTIGGFIGVLLLVSLVVFLLWRRHRRKHDEQRRKETNALQAAQQVLPVASRRTQLPPLRI